MSAVEPLRAFTYEDFVRFSGREIGVSAWHAVDQRRIERFAQVLPTASVRATRPGDGEPDAPTADGYLILSLVSTMAEEAMPLVARGLLGINYGFDRVRFLAPVRGGAQVRGRFVLQTAVRPSDDELRLFIGVTVEIAGSDEPALVADWLTLWQLRHAGRVGDENTVR